MTIHLCALPYTSETTERIHHYIQLVEKNDCLVFYGSGKDLATALAEQTDNDKLKMPHSVQLYILQSEHDHIKLPKTTACDQKIQELSQTELLAQLKEHQTVITWK